MLLLKKQFQRSSVISSVSSNAGGRTNTCIALRQYNQHVLYLCAGHVKFRVWVYYGSLFIISTKYTRTKCSEELNLGNYFYDYCSINALKWNEIDIFIFVGFRFIAFYFKKFCHILYSFLNFLPTDHFHL